MKEFIYQKEKVKSFLILPISEVEDRGAIMDIAELTILCYTFIGVYTILLTGATFQLVRIQKRAKGGMQVQRAEVGHLGK